MTSLIAGHQLYAHIQVSVRSIYDRRQLNILLLLLIVPRGLERDRLLLTRPTDGLDHIAHCHAVGGWVGVEGGGWRVLGGVGGWWGWRVEGGGWGWRVEGEGGGWRVVGVEGGGRGLSTGVFGDVAGCRRVLGGGA